VIDRAIILSWYQYNWCCVYSECQKYAN